MNKTKIEWCDSSWNPVTGCLQGCTYCYARRIATRFGSWQRPTAPKYVFDEPFMINGKVAPYPYGFIPTFHRYKLDEITHWRKPRNIFVGSMTDLFGAWIPDEWIEEVFAACQKSPQHRYLFLTKNPDRYIDLDNKHILPWSNNFWFGTTVTKPDENYTWFKDKEFHWFLSIEPMLARFGAIDEAHLPEWIIIGAETGNRVNKVIPEKEWIDDIVRLCDEHNISLFMKDSLLPIMGEENMRREFPWTSVRDRCEK